MRREETPSPHAESHVAAPNNPPRWDIGAVSAALNAEPALASDVAHASGASWRLGGDPREQTDLAVFPEAGVVRVTNEAEGVQVTLYRQHQGPTVEPGGHVVFEFPSKPDHRRLSVAPSGAATICIDPNLTEGTEIASTVGAAEKRPDVPPPPQTGASGHHRAAQTVSAERSASKEKRPYLSLSGTLVAAPTYRVTKAGKRVAELLLELPEERLVGQTQTRLIKAVAFGDLADRARDRLQQGSPATVNGYLHDVEFTRNGERVREDQLWAAAVIRGDGKKNQP